MQQELLCLGGQQQPAVEQEAYLVPPGQGDAGVSAGACKVVEGEGTLG